MNLQVLTSGSVYTIFALLLCLLFIYGSLAFLRILNRKMDLLGEFRKNNIAYALLAGATIFSIGWIMRSVADPAVAAFNTVLNDPKAVFSDHLRIALTILLQIVISGLIACGMIALGLWIFMKLTKDIDEMKEIGNNNIALGILVAAIIITLAIFIQPGIRMLLEGMIPYPPIDIGR